MRRSESLGHHYSEASIVIWLDSDAHRNIPDTEIQIPGAGHQKLAALSAASCMSLLTPMNLQDFSTST